MPLNWAMTQNNLGNALWSLGAREIGTAWLQEAVATFRAALEERTRDRVPLDWAGTYFNMAFVDVALFDKTGKAAHLDAVETNVRKAREVFGQAGASHYLGLADKKLAEISERRSAVR